MLLRARVLQVFELSPDEGLNLIKAWLVVHGHSLYSSVWSDQPPLLTHALSWIVRAAGHTVAMPRLGMMLASTAFLWGMGRYLVRTAGLPHALAAQTLVLSQPAFFWCSGAVMVGLPSLYLAFAASWALLRVQGGHRWRWIVPSAVLLSLSMMTKLFTAVLIPVAMMFLVMRCTTPGVESWPHRAMGVLGWALCLVVSLLGIARHLVGLEHLYQLVDVHLRVRIQTDNVRWMDESLWGHLEPVPWLLPLALLGAAFALYHRDADRLYFAGWAATGTASLCLHSPVWEHQIFLSSLPGALLGGYAVGEIYHLVSPRAPGAGVPRLGTSISMVIVFSLATFGLLSTTLRNTDRQRFHPKAASPTVQDLIKALVPRGAQDSMVITDRPMLAYRAGRAVPPWIAVLTQKRLAAGDLTEKEVEQEISNHAPATVVLARFPFLELRQSLARSHRLEFSNSIGSIWSPRFPRRPLGEMSLIQREWVAALHRPASWYRSGDARKIAAVVTRTQGPDGGWAKCMSPRGAQLLTAASSRDSRKHDDDQSLDNKSTLSQVRFLIRVRLGNDSPEYAGSLFRGIDYLLASQYPCGGWPQSYPRARSYHALATLNDGVTVETARTLARLKEPEMQHLIGADRLPRVLEAWTRALEFFVRSQVQVAGQRTGWCQQYDPVTLEPRSARTFEPVALASRETVAVLDLLMEQEAPSAVHVEAVHAGVRWLRAMRLEGLRIEERPLAGGGLDRAVVPDPGAPPLWARFYSLDTHRPVFVGRDGVPRDNLNELEAERRGGYDFYLTDPQPLIESRYPTWCQRLHTSPSDSGSEGREP